MVVQTTLPPVTGGADQYDSYLDGEDDEPQAVVAVLRGVEDDAPEDEPLADSPIDPAMAQALRAMEEFDIGRFIGNVGQGDYLEVKYRILWFRYVWPQGKLTTEMTHHEVTPQRSEAIFRATVDCAALGGPVASGYGSETRADFGDYLEKAETKAIGRALEHAGFGTADALIRAGRAMQVSQGKQGKRTVQPTQQAPQRQVSASGEVQYQRPVAVPTGGGGGIDDLIGRINAGQIAKEAWPAFYNEHAKGLDREAQRKLTGAWLAHKKAQGW